MGKHGKTHAIRREQEDVEKRNWRLAGDTNIKCKKVGYAIVGSKIATRRWLKLYMLSRLSTLWKLPPFTFLLHSEEIDGIQWTRTDKKRWCEISLHYVTWTGPRLDWWLCKCSSGWHCCTFSTGTWTLHDKAFYFYFCADHSMAGLQWVQTIFRPNGLRRFLSRTFFPGGCSGCWRSYESLSVDLRWI